MESISRDVKALASDERQLFELVVGHSLRENQRIVIRVIDLESEPDSASRQAALQHAADLARAGREAAQGQGITEEEASAAIDGAIDEVRRARRTQQ